MASIIDAETVQWAIKCCTPDFFVLSDQSSCLDASNFIGVFTLCPINLPPNYTQQATTRQLNPMAHGDDLRTVRRGELL